MHLLHITFVLGILLSVSFVARAGSRPRIRMRRLADSPTNGYNVEINTAQKIHKLNLRQVNEDESLLGENFQFLTTQKGEDGKTMYKRWIPSEEEIKASQSVFVDESTKSVVRIARNANGEDQMSGVVDGETFSQGEDGDFYLNEMKREGRNDALTSDFIKNSGSNQSSYTAADGKPNVVVELVVFLDKEFGDIFNHNKRQILDYLTVYFWDMNLRYKTLKKAHLKFRLNGIVVYSRKEDQPFIEQARKPDGKVDLGKLIHTYTDWGYPYQYQWPKFDLAIVIVGAPVVWGGGVAWMEGACAFDHHGKRLFNTAVWNDAGDWRSVTVGAHEVGHSVGAPHDDDPNFPGTCVERGFIMGGGNAEKKWFFSTCSDDKISEFLKKSKADCLRTINEPNFPAVPSQFNHVLAPSMAEQCKRISKNSQAYVEDRDLSNCKDMQCKIPGGRSFTHAPVDNTPCADGGRCFRGICRPRFVVLQNVGTNLCLSPPKLSGSQAPNGLACECVSNPTQEDGVVLIDSGNGLYKLSVPRHVIRSNGDFENTEQCLDHTWTALFYRECTGGSDPTTRLWKFTQVSSDELLIQRVNRDRTPSQCMIVHKDSWRGPSLGIQSCNATSHETAHKWKVLTYG